MASSRRPTVARPRTALGPGPTGVEIDLLLQQARAATTRSTRAREPFEAAITTVLFLATAAVTGYDVHLVLAALRG